MGAGAVRGAPVAFVGEDRRRAPPDPGLGTVVLAGGVAVAVSTVAVVLAPAPARPEDVHLVLDTVTTVAAVAIFALCRARWQLTGITAALWAGTGALVIGVANVGLPRVIAPLFSGQPADFDSPLVRAGLWVALGAFLAGGLAAAVDTRVRPLLLSAGAAVAVAVMYIPFAVGPDLPMTALAVAASAAIGLVYVARATQRRARPAWCAVLLLGLGASQVETGVAASVALAAACTAATIACAQELARDYTDQRRRLFDSEITLEATEVGERLQAAGRRQRRHDVRNAVLAIGGSAVTLERHLERLSEADRASLTDVLSAGVERLQRLLGDEAGGDATVHLASLAATVAAEHEGLVVDVPDALVATGSVALATEVARILVDNARQRAPGQRVVLEGRREADWIILQVRDRAAPVPRDERRTFVDADRALLVAARLMRGQGGDVWIESHPDGGAFSLCLPAATVEADGQAEGAARAGA